MVVQGVIYGKNKKWVAKKIVAMTQETTPPTIQVL
jgi:hypothetical protein